MKKLQSWLRKTFGFSQRETRGFIVLVSLMILVLILPVIYDWIVVSPQASTRRDKQLMDSLLTIIHNGDNSPSVLSSSVTPSGLFPFDPNTSQRDELEKIFGDKIASTIVRFRERNGKFYIKSDLKKIYGLSNDQYLRVKPFVLLPDSLTQKNKSERLQTAAKSHIEIDINKSIAEDLEKIRGIGKVLSVRIIKYRDKLGGFVSEDQFAEVYGLDSLTLFNLRNASFVSEDFTPSKLMLNTATYEELKSHPYIGGKYASEMIRFRKQQGGILKDLSELYLLKTIPAGDIRRMNYYLRVE